MFVYYDESILSYVACIRDSFGLSSSYAPNTKFKDYLNKKNPQKIFLILIDGMGANLIERKLSKDSFLRKNLFKKVTTVFPTTTTAALTSISNGKSPNENAWLGWMEYLEEIDDIIVPFLGESYYEDKKHDEDICYKLRPFKTTVEELNEIGIKAINLYPDFIEGGCKDFTEFKNRLIDLSYSDNKYVFAYWDKYDTIMHLEGPNSAKADSYLKMINDGLEEVSNNISDDTMLVIVADHGQSEIDLPYYIEGSKYEKYMYRKPIIESRSPGFYIKEEYRKEFEAEFKKGFENDFILLDKQDIIDTKLFGYHDNHPKFESMLPDYLAIGKSRKVIRWCPLEVELQGQHAGISDDELYIPLITYKK